MSMKIFSKSCVATLLLAGFVLPATQARAGFEWVAPSSGGSTTISNSYAAAPTTLSPISSSDVISPVIISGDSQSRSMPQILTPPPAPVPAPVVPASQMRSDDRQSLATATIDIPSNATTLNAPTGDGVVQGFATQVPLTLALRQILPNGYNFTIDQDVSMDTPVSYNGGKPWRETVTTMLASVGLIGLEQAKVYSVSRAQVTPSPIISDEGGTPLQDKSVMHSSFPAPAPQIMSVTTPAPPAPFTMGAASTTDEWTAERGDTLRKVLTDWCRRSNVELQWMTEYDYPIEGSSHFNAGFEDAVRGLLAGFDSARPQPVGELHDSTTAGQKVLVVQARGNNYTN